MSIMLKDLQAKVREQSENIRASATLTEDEQLDRIVVIVIEKLGKHVSGSGEVIDTRPALSRSGYSEQKGPAYSRYNGYPPIESGTRVRARIKRDRKNDYNTAGTSLRERHDGQVGLVWDFSDA